MKAFLKPFIAISLIFFGLNIYISAQSNFLITPDSAGSIKIGMTVAEARRAYPRYTFSRASDGEGIALIEVKNRGRTHFFLYANEFDPSQPINNTAKIVFIEVTNPAYRTTKGVSVNMNLSRVARIYGNLQSIVLSEIESREYARFANQPLGIDLKVLNRNGQAGIYANGEMRTTRYSNNAYIGSIILLGRDSSTGGTIDNNDGDNTDGDGNDGGATVEMGFTSKYTNLETQCRTSNNNQNNRRNTSTYCNGYGDYRVHIYDSPRAMEITVESTVARKNVSLARQSLGFDLNDKQIEWRFKDGKPFAVIMRAEEYRVNRDGSIRYPIRKTGETIVVKGLPGFEKIDFKVDPRRTRNAEEEARRLADNAYVKVDETSNEFENVDIAPFNRTLSNAARRNRAWVKNAMQVAARIAGEIKETRTRTMEMEFPSAESTNEMTLTITNEGLLDDSVKAERFVYYLKKNSRGVWSIDSAQKSWSCQRNRGHQDFSAVPCN